MKLTIIEAGLAPEPIRHQFPDYPAMFEQLISQADTTLDYETVSIVKGAPLPDPASLDAILITGSPFGVYDDESWMTPLMDFIRWAANASTPQIGVCFGHQIIAKAMGARVEKSDKGWGVGRHVYTMGGSPHWMKDTPNTAAFAVSHQDQVLSLPIGADVLASSAFTPYAALIYQQAPIISVQGHPEFENDFAGALYNCRRARLGETLANEAVASLDHPHDNQSAASWMAAFLAANH